MMPVTGAHTTPVKKGGHSHDRKNFRRHIEARARQPAQRPDSRRAPQNLDTSRQCDSLLRRSQANSEDCETCPTAASLLACRAAEGLFCLP
jgi:hypothetical protein